MSLIDQAYRKLHYYKIDGRSGEVDFFLMSYHTFKALRFEVDRSFDIVREQRPGTMDWWYKLFGKPVVLSDAVPDGEILGLVKVD